MMAVSPRRAVAPREGGVDRNTITRTAPQSIWKSPPARGAWIATPAWRRMLPCLQSPPARGAWIATLRDSCRLLELGSPPARGAWIATSFPHKVRAQQNVAPREGGVDRNDGPAARAGQLDVAPREGGVDRNPSRESDLTLPGCRPPRGGRGSQRVGAGLEVAALESPPARGAWIATSGESHVC